MKKLFMFVLPLVVFSFVFAGCGKDNDESSVAFDQSTVVGSWTITSVSNTSPWSWVAIGSNLIFNSNGSCTTEFGMENSWKLEGGKIKTYYKATDEPILVYTLLSQDGADYNVKVSGTLDESNLSVVVKMRKK